MGVEVGYIVLRYTAWQTPRRAADTPAGGGLADTPAGSGQRTGGHPGGHYSAGNGHTCLRYGGKEIRREPQGGGREDVSTTGTIAKISGNAQCFVQYLSGTIFKWHCVLKCCWRKNAASSIEIRCGLLNKAERVAIYIYINIASPPH